jgi:hypothetical protein
MDTLHTVMRSIRGETKASRNHISVFRQFLDHLDRIARTRAARGRVAKAGKAGGTVVTGRSGKK